MNGVDVRLWAKTDRRLERLTCREAACTTRAHDV